MYTLILLALAADTPVALGEKPVTVVVRLDKAAQKAFLAGQHGTLVLKGFVPHSGWAGGRAFVNLTDERSQYLNQHSTSYVSGWAFYGTGLQNVYLTLDGVKPEVLTREDPASYSDNLQGSRKAPRSIRVTVVGIPSAQKKRSTTPIPIKEISIKFYK